MLLPKKSGSIVSRSALGWSKYGVKRKAELELARVKLWQRGRILFRRRFHGALRIVLGGDGLFRFIMRTRFKNSHGHEMRMRSFPRKRRFFGFEKSIDHHCVALRGCPSARPGRCATHDCRSAIYRNASRIRKQNAATKRNSFRIDGAVSIAQLRTVRTCTYLTFTAPINRNPRKQRIFGRKNRSCDQESKAGYE